MASTHSSATIGISTTVENSDLDAAGFALLTYTAIGGLGSFGEYGIATNIVTYDTWSDEVVLKAKGMTNAGDPTLEVARIAGDAGQAALRAAGAVAVKDNYAFKVTLQDGAVRYLRGLVSGPRHPSGRNEDFDLETYTVALNQTPVDV